MIIAIPKETAALEQRVSLTPEITGKLINKGITIKIEKDAGLASNFLDSQYIDAGAEIDSDRTSLFKNADVIVSVQVPSDKDLKLMKKGSILISFIWALQNSKLVTLLQNQEITALGMDAIPQFLELKIWMHYHP